MYMITVKGQLPMTPSDLILGSRHIILIAINAYSTFRAVEADATKDGLQKLLLIQTCPGDTGHLGSRHFWHDHSQVRADRASQQSGLDPVHRLCRVLLE
ncbi:hypothetical protein BGZ65_011073 [Modicella reniformis]|uniref:Uncharacterized protein n=1 Tax=Modicella reniformis TaxID=1440133 RepID=A0A9P6MDT6_9FUNG|nr:hypothetical protein BGZ65_011073 [Modicella reniformis]